MEKEKIQAWKCSGCYHREKPCVVFDLEHGSGILDFNKCGTDIISWQKTDKFKIVEVEKKSPMQEALDHLAKCGIFPPNGPNEKLHVFGSEDKMSKFLKDRVEPNLSFGRYYQMLNRSIRPQTPNCAICEWKREEKRLDVDDPNSYLNFCMCTAQGMKDCDDEAYEGKVHTPGVYNSKECQKLFKPVEDHTPSFKKWITENPDATWIPALFGQALFTQEEFWKEQERAQKMAWDAAMNLAKS